MQDAITESIIKYGKMEFLENGFEKASLQEICKKSNITTGAFYRRFKSKIDLFEEIVSPSVMSLRNLVSSPEEDVPSFVRKVLKGKLDEDTLIDFYSHRENLMLLLNAAEGTKYAEFSHRISSRLTEITYKYLLDQNRKPKLKKSELHIFMSSYLSAIFEAVIHANSKDEMKNFVESLNDFYNWERVLNS